ncbi:MAG: hypothetical protein GEU96_05695 [Propionibacteriales bacterium]|nr:hypothetical protein [Propionibacteriales bacterium]
MSLRENEIIERTAALPERFADRLPETTRHHLTSARDAGEWSEVVDNLVAALRNNHVTVSTTEWEDLREIAELMGLPTGTLDELDPRD